MKAQCHIRECHISCQYTVLALRPNVFQKQIYIRSPGENIREQVWTGNQMHVQPPGPGIDPGTHWCNARDFLLLQHRPFFKCEHALCWFEKVMYVYVSLLIDVAFDSDVNILKEKYKQ